MIYWLWSDIYSSTWWDLFNNIGDVLSVWSRVNRNLPKYFQIENFNFETVHSFTYLGSLINANNDKSAEIKKRILLANTGFYGLKKQFKSQSLST
jgi:hypothetical protein